MNVCRVFAYLCALSTLAFSLSAPGQVSDGSGPASRLHGAVRSQTRTVLAGSALSYLRQMPDLGTVPAAYPLHGITLVLRRSMVQQADLSQLLAAQQDPASEQFHRWLTPESFADRFGASESDLAAVEHWLTDQGFTLTGRSRARDRITFSGTAAQVTVAFGSPLHHVQINGESHVGPVADLTLPTDLAAITIAILHLSDLRPHPQVHIAPHPAYTTSTGTHHLTPYDLQVLYDIPNDPHTNFAGAGQNLAIVGQSYTLTNDEFPLGDFQGSYTQAGGSPNSLLVPGTGVEAIVPGDEGEADIDLEYASASVPGALLLYVHVGSDPHYNVFDALTFAIDQDLAPVISISYAECETLVSPAEAAQGNALFQQANAQGQTIIAASGDAGSTACAYYPTSSYLSTSQQQALAVEYPASSPYVTAVGGTQMAAATFAAGSPSWSGTTSTATNKVATLLDYVPEVAWNEGSAKSGILAGGGGVSALFARPNWQSGFPGIPAGNTRLVPDIALQSSITSPGFVYCTDDRALGASGNIDSCIGKDGGVLVAGGTSFAAPTFASIVTLLNQTMQQGGQGNINPTLYSLAASAPPAFHDITSGTIACVAGAARCSAAGQSGFTASTGYDEATGLGSLDVKRLFAAWPAPATPALTATQVYFTSDLYPLEYLAPGTSTSLGVGAADVVTNASATPPTGTISVELDGALLSTVPLTNPFSTPSDVGNSGYVTVPAPTSSGVHVFHLAYSGDSTHAPASSASAFTIGSQAATGSITLAANNITLLANGSGTTSVAITPAGGYDGRLSWALAITGSSNGSGLTGCYSIPSVVVDGPTTTTLSLGVGTACSSAQPSARGKLRQLPALHASNSPRSAVWHSSTTIAAGLLLLVFVPAASRRKLSSLLTLLVMLAVIPGVLTGCGSGANTGGANTGGGSNPTPPASPAVTYTFTLTGTDSVTVSVQSSTTFTVTVQ